jgi:hypothetical protein
MIESAPEAFGQENRCAGAGDVGAKSGDKRKRRSTENFGGMPIGVVKRNRLAVERRCPHPYPDLRPAPAKLRSEPAK